MEIAARRELERKAREKSIIDTAEQLFQEKGFEATSMDEIARTTGFTKRTIYQYFLRKEELLFAVAVSQLSKTDFVPLAEKNKRVILAFEWLRNSCEQFFFTCQRNPVETAFVTRAFSILDSTDNGTWKSVFQKRTMSYYQLIVESLKEGISEGSVRGDIEPEKAAFTFIFLLTNFMKYLSVENAQASIYRPMPIEELFQYSLDLLLYSIKS